MQVKTTTIFMALKAIVGAILAGVIGFVIGHVLFFVWAIISPLPLTRATYVAVVAIFSGGLAWGTYEVLKNNVRTLKSEKSFFGKVEVAQKSAMLAKKLEIRRLAKRVQENPNNANLHLELARLLRPQRTPGLDLVNFDKRAFRNSALQAEAEYTQAISIEPTLLSAHLELGMLYMGMHRIFSNIKGSNVLKKAEKEFFEVIKFDPENFRAYKCLGIIMAWMKNYEKAEMYFKKALKLCSKEEAKLIEGKLGYVLENMGKVREAGEHYRRIFSEYNVNLHKIEYARGVVEPDKEDPTKGRYYEIGFRLIDKNTGRIIRTEPCRIQTDWID